MSKKPTEAEARASELRSRNFWDECAAYEVMSVIERGLRSDVYRDGMMKVHFHLVYHFAHDENRSVDFYVGHPDLTRKISRDTKGDHDVDIAARIIAGMRGSKAEAA